MNFSSRGFLLVYKAMDVDCFLLNNFKSIYNLLDWVVNAIEITIPFEQIMKSK